MSGFTAVLIFGFIGVIGARQADIDINRIKLLPTRELKGGNSPYYYSRASETEQIQKTNDYDDHSFGPYGSHAPFQVLHDSSPSTIEKESIRVHQPREDPKLFYQSDSYIKEISPIKITNEVSEIYPGINVVRPEEKLHRISLPYVPIERMKMSLPIRDLKTCMKCPHDRVLVAKAGSDRTILQSPRLLTCNGQRTPKNVHFVHMYGPKFGSLLKKGSHMVMGSIMQGATTLQLCKMQVEVVVQACSTPKYLIADCDQDHKTCHFKCRNIKLDLHGQSSLICGDDMNWNGSLPVCKVRNWCELPSPPVHGHISCQGNPVREGLGLEEGAKCRVQCSTGWRWKPRVATVCRRGVWTRALTCKPMRSS